MASVMIWTELSLGMSNEIMLGGDPLHRELDEVKHWCLALSADLEC